MNEIEVGGAMYQVGKLPAMAQFHVVRRIAPVLASMGESISELAGSGGDLKNDAQLLVVMSKASEVVSKMADQDVEYVINTCLSVVRRKQGERWQIVMNGRNFQFSDIDMPTMMRLTVEVLKENLGNFFPKPQGDSSTQIG